jgi:hypothetical protein
MSIMQKVQSSGQTIKIYKVKAHTGVLGNEYADEAAKRATELLAGDRTSQQPVACAADAAPPYTDMYWPVVASSSQLQDWVGVPPWVGESSVRIRVVGAGQPVGQMLPIQA